jgi:type IV pilus assembly protein PilW
MNRLLKQRCRERGFSLVEIMLALVISLMLMAGIIQIFISSKQSYRLQEGQSRIQENARYAMELLQRDLRIAGYMGCNVDSNLRKIANEPVGVDFTSSVTGNEATGSSWSPALPPVLSSMTTPNHVIKGTDVVRIDYAESCGGNLTGNMDPSNASIQIIYPNNCNLQQSSCSGGTCTGEVILIADCQNSDLFRASSVSDGTTKQTLATASNVNTNNKLRIYQDDAELLKPRAFTYFIRLGQSGSPALWRLNNLAALGTDNPQELVDGIEDMQILYGEDTDADRSPNRYLLAHQVDFTSTRVVSVRIILRVRSVTDNLTQTSRTYSLDGSNVTDRRLIKTFATTIGIRNRLP